MNKLDSGQSLGFQTFRTICPKCIKDFTIVSDKGITLPGQKCQNCGYKIS